MSKHQALCRLHIEKSLVASLYLIIYDVLNIESVEIAIFFASFSPEFLAPSFSLFARVIEQAQAASVLHQLPSVNSDLNKYHTSVIRTIWFALRIVKDSFVESCDCKAKYLVKDISFTDKVINGFLVYFSLFLAWLKFW